MKQRIYTPRLLRRIKRSAEKTSWYQASKKFNIPPGSIRYIQRLAGKVPQPKGNSDVRPIKVYIKKVIIHIKP